MAVMDTPKTLNGHPVIRVEQHKNCATVMMDAPGEYIVATWWPELKSSWSWGHYFPGPGDRFNEAMAAFNEAATRNKDR